MSIQQSAAGQKSAGSSKSGKSTEGYDFVISRLFNAPRALVFRAWTEPERLAQWWGPRMMECPVCQVDARPGGALRIVMRAPDGQDYPMKGVFIDVVEPERIVYTCDLSEHPEAWHDLMDPNWDRSKGRPAYNLVTTVTFEERQNRTLVTVKMTFTSAAVRDSFARHGMNEGWSSSLDRLEEHLVEGRGMVATRIFDAPRDLVFQMWTDPKEIAQWWGPNGFTNTIEQMDVRPGGEWKFVMHGPDGRDYPNKIVYEEVVRPERLVYSHVSGPLFRATVTFTELGTELEPKTEVTVRMVFESAELRTQIARDHKAVEGLQETLGRLAERLAQR